MRRAKTIIFITVLIDLIGFGMIIPLHTYVSRQFGADALDIGILMAIYSAMQFLFAPVWGRLSDRFGRRPVILISLLLAGVSHLLFAFATTYWALFLARALAGVFGGNISTAMAYMADVSENRDRTKSMGLIGAAFGIGFVLGPFFGGILAKVGESLGSAPPYGHSFAAVAAGTICIVNFLVAIFVLKESLKPEDRQVVKRESRVLRVFYILKQPHIGSLVAIYFLLSFAMANMEASLFLFVQDKFGWGLATASYGFAYVGIVMAVVQGGLLRRWVPKYGEKKLFGFGVLCALVGYLGIAYSPDLLTMGITVTIFGLGVGLANPCLTSNISLLAQKSEQGEVMGVNQSMAALARIVGPIIGGYIYKTYMHEAPFLLSSVSLLAVIAWIVSRPGLIQSPGIKA